MSETLEILWNTIKDRQERMPAGSYTASLFEIGLARMAQKVGEEGVEVAVAALSEPEDRVVYEMADLIYHCMVLLAAKGLTWDEVETELEKRFS